MKIGGFRIRHKVVDDYIIYGYINRDKHVYVWLTNAIIHLKLH